MADTLAPLRKVYVKFFEHPILRTEAEIGELKAGGLFVRDAAPEDPLPSHVTAVPAAAGQPARTVVTAPQPGTPERKAGDGT